MFSHSNIFLLIIIICICICICIVISCCLQIVCFFFRARRFGFFNQFFHWYRHHRNNTLLAVFQNSFFSFFTFYFSQICTFWLTTLSIATATIILIFFCYMNCSIKIRVFCLIVVSCVVLIIFFTLIKSLFSVIYKLCVFLRIQLLDTTCWKNIKSLTKMIKTFFISF